MNYHNIEKSSYRPKQYVGYGRMTSWAIRKLGNGRWEAIARDLPYHRIEAFTLRAISQQLEGLTK